MDIGLEPWEALRAATLAPARVVDQGDVSGTIAAGKTADLVLLVGNPLTDIRATREIESVFVRGRHLDSETLASLRGEG